MLQDLILAKPQTYMNQSGIAVKSCVTRYALHVARDLLIVHDDLDIPLGKFKIQKGVGPKLHKGIESIEKELGTKDFWRVRIGVDNRQPKQKNYLVDDRITTNKQREWIDGETYVLQDFTKEERQVLLTQVFPKIVERLKKEF